MRAFPTTPALVALLALAACATLRQEPAGGDAAAAFPHPAGYDDPDLHGADYLGDGGGAACLACHPVESAGAGGAPACRSCHAPFPHPDEDEAGGDWMDGAIHGAGILVDLDAKTPALSESGQAALDACLDCHGREGARAPACTRCHASWPHPDGWEEAGQHGAYALARGSVAAVCGTCHGADLLGGDTGVSCAACHAAYPHAEGFEDGETHGAAAKKDLQACLDCHGEDGAAIAAGACSRCHAPYPHGAGFDHVSAAAVSGEAVCLTCHEAGDGMAGMPAGCGATCHGGAR